MSADELDPYVDRIMAVANELEYSQKMTALSMAIARGMAEGALDAGKNVAEVPARIWHTIEALAACYWLKAVTKKKPDDDDRVRARQDDADK